MEKKLCDAFLSEWTKLNNEMILRYFIFEDKKKDRRIEIMGKEVYQIERKSLNFASDATSLASGRARRFPRCRINGNSRSLVHGHDRVIGRGFWRVVVWHNRGRCFVAPRRQRRRRRSRIVIVWDRMMARFYINSNYCWSWSCTWTGHRA